MKFRETHTGSSMHPCQTPLRITNSASGQQPPPHSNEHSCCRCQHAQPSSVKYHSSIASDEIMLTTSWLQHACCQSCHRIAETESADSYLRIMDYTCTLDCVGFGEQLNNCNCARTNNETTDVRTNDRNCNMDYQTTSRKVHTFKNANACTLDCTNGPNYLHRNCCSGCKHEYKLLNTDVKTGFKKSQSPEQAQNISAHLPKSFYKPHNCLGDTRDLHGSKGLVTACKRSNSCGRIGMACDVDLNNAGLRHNGFCYGEKECCGSNLNEEMSDFGDDRSENRLYKRSNCLSNSSSKTVADMNITMDLSSEGTKTSFRGVSKNRLKGAGRHPKSCSTPSSSVWPKNLLHLLKWIALIFSVEALAVEAQAMGPRYRTNRRLCVSDDECNSAIGEVCWWAWDGCDTGECMCDPRISFHDASMHFCRPLKFGDERCEAGDKCWEGMSCTGGYCKCKRGTMTSDRMFCQENFQRLLGQTCSMFSDICYQRAVHGYIRKETHCGIDGVCRCNSGYKTDGKACRKWKVNEPGCSEDHHCEGGALCIDNICQCPSTYQSVAGNSKCAKLGARYDLHLGEICNEIDERGYCAQGLICHRCPSETLHKCVRFVEAEALPYHFAGGNRKTFNAIYIVLAALTAVIYICTFCCR